jgi:hypothetical protein
MLRSLTFVWPGHRESLVHLARAEAAMPTTRFLSAVLALASHLDPPNPPTVTIAPVNSAITGHTHDANSRSSVRIHHAESIKPSRGQQSLPCAACASTPKWPAWYSAHIWRMLGSDKKLVRNARGFRRVFCQSSFLARAQNPRVPSISPATPSSADEILGSNAERVRLNIPHRDDRSPRSSLSAATSVGSCRFPARKPLKNSVSCG